MNRGIRCFGKCLMFVLLVCACLGSGRAAVSAASYFNVNGRTLEITGAENNDIYPAIKSAVDYARKADPSAIYTIRVPAGEYELSSTIRLYGNVCLDLTDVTMNYTGKSGNMVMLGTKAVNMDLSLIHI